MPWFEQAVFLTPADSATAELRTVLQLRDHLYYVRDLNHHAWYADHMRHNVSPGGLAVIRTIGDPADELAQHDLSWHNVPYVEDCPLEIDPAIPYVVTCMKEALHPCPPTRFLKYLKHLSVAHSATVVLYSGASWGGPIEFEYAWVFQPRESVYCLDDPSNGYRVFRANAEPEIEKGQIQRKAMMQLGVKLPSLYCAFFDSALDWERFRVRPSTA